MEKTFPHSDSDSFAQGENQQPFSCEDSFLAETLLSYRGTSQQEFSFVVRMSKSEREVINRISRDFNENLVTIFTKSLRIYRAIAEAADQGGSLVMLTDKSGISTEDTRNHNTHHLQDRAIYSYQATKKINRKISLGASVSVVDPPFKSNDNNADDNVLNEQEASNLRSINDNTNTGISEAIIAVRDQFADNNLTPIRLNTQYITQPKGLKSEKITLKTDATFTERIQILERKTGLKKSVIVRDSIQLYDFIKRHFNKKNVIFFIGGTRIEAV